MISRQRKNQHLMWRAGFGPAAEQLSQLSTVEPGQLYKALQKASASKPDYLDVADNYLKGLFMGIDDAGREARRNLDAEQRRMIQQKQRDGIRNLNLLWLSGFSDSKAQLREKMALFWHGHFASRNLNIFFQQQLLDIIRQNALGSFRTLLHETSQSAAILNFLNAQQNRKGHPNENFAREVMELFTLGRGHYIENDVKEAARAFTGWGANTRGEFTFRRFQHDAGAKTVLGKSGNLTGEEVLDLLLDQPQCARFITRKIYRFFVNDIPDEAHVEALSKRFYQSDYNISALMEDIFTSDWFYEEKNMGVKIKSPVELIAGIRRMLPMELSNEDGWLLVQRLLGQMLFYPPNVAGWPGGRTWIDSTTLMTRMRLPQMLNQRDELNIRPKTDDDQMMGRMDPQRPETKAAGPRRGRNLDATIDWTNYTKYYESIAREGLPAALQGVLLQVQPHYAAELVKNYSDGSSREAFVRSATLQIMSTPEYQLC